jgi:hypothetical protein
VRSVEKAGFVAATAVGLMMVGCTAFVSPMVSETAPDPTFGDTYDTFIDGGGALGYGAASLVAGAYTGIALTPAWIMHSLSEH